MNRQEQTRDIIKKIRKRELDEISLLDLVTDNDVKVAIAVAQSEDATEPILDIAAHDKDKAVRLEAAKNLNTGNQTLMLLAQDMDQEVADVAFEHLMRRKENEVVL